MLFYFFSSLIRCSLASLPILNVDVSRFKYVSTPTYVRTTGCYYSAYTSNCFYLIFQNSLSSWFQERGSFFADIRSVNLVIITEARFHSMLADMGWGFSKASVCPCHFDSTSARYSVICQTPMCTVILSKDSVIQ
jgi:hypothetical protein